MLPLGHSFRTFGISFQCYADNTQMYLPLKRKYIVSLVPLMQCLEEIKAWMALNFLNFNENKIPGDICESVDLDLGELKSLVKILGVFLDCDFKLNIQISSVIKSSFFPVTHQGEICPAS